jgi:hypothetical protein
MLQIALRLLAGKILPQPPCGLASLGIFIPGEIQLETAAIQDFMCPSVPSHARARTERELSPSIIKNPLQIQSAT